MIVASHRRCRPRPLVCMCVRRIETLIHVSRRNESPLQLKGGGVIKSTYPGKFPYGKSKNGYGSFGKPMGQLPTKRNLGYDCCVHLIWESVEGVRFGLNQKLNAETIDFGKPTFASSLILRHPRFLETKGQPSQFGGPPVSPGFKGQSGNHSFHGLSFAASPQKGPLEEAAFSMKPTKRGRHCVSGEIGAIEAT